MILTCIICNGKGIVKAHFYDIDDTCTCKNPNKPVKCRACDGHGIVKDDYAITYHTSPPPVWVPYSSPSPIIYPQVWSTSFDTSKNCSNVQDNSAKSSFSTVDDKNTEYYI